MFVPLSGRLPPDSLGALMGLPGVFGVPRKAGSCEGTVVGFPSSGRFTPACGLGTVPSVCNSVAMLQRCVTGRALFRQWQKAVGLSKRFSAARCRWHPRPHLDTKRKTQRFTARSPLSSLLTPAEDETTTTQRSTPTAPAADRCRRRHSTLATQSWRWSRCARRGRWRVCIPRAAASQRSKAPRAASRAPATAQWRAVGTRAPAQRCSS